MTLNEEELKKIKNATSGFFKKSARVALARELVRLESELVVNVSKLSTEERESRLKDLLRMATGARKRALQSGANSYGHPQWAAAAACESWLLELLRGTPESIARVEAIIKELIIQGQPKVDDTFSEW